MLFLTPQTITMDNETEVLNVEELSGDLYNHILESLVEVEADWINIWTGELFSFSISVVVLSVSWCSLY